MKSIWKGALSFGLVNIPVHMYTASREKEISFVLLHKKDLSQIRYARMCKAEDKEVPWSEIVKGYEFEKGEFVIFEESDFEKANLKKTKTIEIVSFAEEEEVDSLYFSKPYFLEPDKNAEKAYVLLREALKQSKKVGIAKYVLRNKEHIAVVKIYEHMIILLEMRYASEVQIPDLAIPKTEKPSVKEIEIAKHLIDHLTAPFNAADYKDTYTEEIKQIIKKKSKGKPVHPKTEEPKITRVQDIMSLLEESLKNTKNTKKPAKKSRKTA